MISLHFEIEKCYAPYPVKCNFCNKKAMPVGWHTATILPFEDGTPFTFIVCGPECEKEFLSAPGIEFHIMQIIVEASRMNKKALNDEYKLICIKMADN